MGLNALIISTVIVGTSILVGIGYKRIFKPVDDNPIEEICEIIIKEKTGFDVDFTPKSSEKKKVEKAKEEKNESKS